MGSKTKARELMQKAGVPIVPGVTEPVETVEDAKKIAEEIGYPIAVKAAGGGGGKGFRVAMKAENLKDAFEGAAREGEKFFSDDTVYLERYLEDPRHVEVQILADKHGNVIHLGERDCSIQRRHQKLIEESPGPLVDEEMREKIGKIGVDAAKAVDYHSAGTIEGLFVKQDDGPDEYFFLEMNTRVQVEHCVTEAITGIDIVREQILIAAGEELSIKQEDVQLRGHAIECRINAENAATNFSPAPGLVTAYFEPSGPGIRVDSGVLAGSEITPLYDPMVAKLIVWDSDRELATKRMLRALDEFKVEGVTTLMPFHKAIMASEQWANAETCRDLIEDEEWLQVARRGRRPSRPDDEEELRGARLHRRGRRASASRSRSTARRSRAAGGAPATAPRRPQGPQARRAQVRRRRRRRRAHLARCRATCGRSLVAEGDEVEEGQLICIIEAMKMENEITAHKAGTIAKLAAKEGEPIKTGDPIATITAAEARGRRRSRFLTASGSPTPDEAEHVARLLIALPRVVRRRLALRQRLPGRRRAADREPRHGVPARHARRRLAALRRRPAALPLLDLDRRRRTAGSRTSSSTDERAPHRPRPRDGRGGDRPRRAAQLPPHRARRRRRQRPGPRAVPGDGLRREARRRRASRAPPLSPSAGSG